MPGTKQNRRFSREEAVRLIMHDSDSGESYESSENDSDSESEVRTQTLLHLPHLYSL